MAGCLSVVATPIGNLEDMTLRALRVLREADLVAAEDTRRTARLLQHYSISTPTTSLHEHNERRRIPALLARLEAGARIALVSDAGTPGVSDPGARLVAAALERGIRVEPIPGASAVTAALMVSGFPADRFTFVGFPPARGSARDAWFQELAAHRETIVLFEAPHRMASSLGLLAKYMPDRPIAIAREMTKHHEELVRCHISDAPNRLSRLLGEFTVVIGPATPQRDTSLYLVDKHKIVGEFRQMTEKSALTRREAIASLARRHGLSQREVYSMIEEAKLNGS